MNFIKVFRNAEQKRISAQCKSRSGVREGLRGYYLGGRNWKKRDGLHGYREYFKLEEQPLASMQIRGMGVDVLGNVRRLLCFLFPNPKNLRQTDEEAFSEEPPPSTQAGELSQIQE